MTQKKPILCLDFDGVIHSYDSGWIDAVTIPDLPVPGAIAFIEEASKHFTIAIYSSRSGQLGGVDAMRRWLEEYMEGDARAVCDGILWPESKPAAFLTIDDRAMLFTGTWPDPQELLKFKPWNKG